MPSLKYITLLLVFMIAIAFIGFELRQLDGVGSVHLFGK